MPREHVRPVARAGVAAGVLVVGVRTVGAAADRLFLRDQVDALQQTLLDPIDGERVAAALGQQLQGLFIEETTAGLCRCEATFVNWGPKNGQVGFLYFDRALLEFGKKLSVEMGAGDGAGKVFDGRITGLEGRFSGGRPPELLVMAEDRLQDLRMTRRTRSWEDSSDADVIRSVAQAHGLTADVDLGGPTHRVVALRGNHDDAALARAFLVLVRDPHALHARLALDGRRKLAHPAGVLRSAQRAFLHQSREQGSDGIQRPSCRRL